MEFVNYDLAKKLKEKGFNDKCFYHWNNGELLCNTCNSESRVTTTDLLMSCNYLVAQFNVEHDNVVCDAPTIAQVLKWMREAKRIDAGAVWDNRDGKWIGYINEMDMPDLAGEYVLPNTYYSYEKAALAGVEYVLDKLI